MSQKYIHCSWDILEPGSLIPRIPKSRVIGPNISEDDSTPRICVADTVQRALMAMPGTGKIIKIMQKYKVPVIIHAYYLEQDWKSIRRPRKNEVPDVELTGKPISPYEYTDFESLAWYLIQTRSKILLREEIAAKFVKASEDQIDELDFFLELRDTGITLELIREYYPEKYDYSKSFMEEHGLF